MQFTDIVARMGGVQAMARELGVRESQAASDADALLPAILGGFKKQAQPSGAQVLGGLLGQLGAAACRGSARRCARFGIPARGDATGGVDLERPAARSGQ